MVQKYDIRNKHAYQILADVHTNMIDTYNFNKTAAIDIDRAERMENILRKIKKINLNTNNNNNITSILDSQVLQITEQALSKMNVLLGSQNLTTKQLFSTVHNQQVDKQLQVDDIFEVELSAVLSSLQSLATNSDINISNNDIISTYTTGRIQGTLEKTTMNMTEDIMDESLQRFVKRIEAQSFNNKAYKSLAASIKKAESRSIKTDIKSYELNITASLKPEWENLYSLFGNARFSVKNYQTSNKKIHLGNTNIYKSIIAQLMYLGYTAKDSKNMFYHFINSWVTRNTQAVAIHIPHLRFAYELEGGKLYDSETGEEISTADFLIVNDPNSENIYVRSTKGIIADALTNTKAQENPFAKEIAINYNFLSKGYQTYKR